MATETPMLTASNLGLLQANLAAAHHLNGFFGNLHTPVDQPLIPNAHGSTLTPRSSWFIGHTSASDVEADHRELQKAISERKLRRMISNRESARRSRMRKQKYVDQLWSQMLWLQDENQDLMEKLNRVTESHGRILEENTWLKKEASDLRQIIGTLDHLIRSPYNDPKDLEGFPCNAAHLRAESVSQCINNGISFSEN